MIDHTHYNKSVINIMTHLLDDGGPFWSPIILNAFICICRMGKKCLNILVRPFVLNVFWVNWRFVILDGSCALIATRANIRQTRMYRWFDLFYGRSDVNTFVQREFYPIRSSVDEALIESLILLQKLYFRNIDLEKAFEVRYRRWKTRYKKYAIIFCG